MHNHDSLEIPSLISGGLMLTYRCSNACRHCLYGCSPKQPNDWITRETAQKVFDALSRESRLEGIHLAGGEATLRMDILVDIIRMACDANIPIDYLETNAVWCTDPERTAQGLLRLKNAGLRTILVSASMFHNEFIPFQRTRNCVEIGRKILGLQNVIVWVPQVYQTLAQMPGAELTHTLEEFFEFAGIEDQPDILPRLYPVNPGGRVAEALRECFTARPAKAFQKESCRGELTSTWHFHIDLYGNLFTGCCAGLAAARVDNLHPSKNRNEHPLFCLLCEKGPTGLTEWAATNHSYQEKREGYISKCDLCLDVRKHLQATHEYDELQPACFYQPLDAKCE